MLNEIQKEFLDKLDGNLQKKYFLYDEEFILRGGLDEILKISEFLDGINAKHCLQPLSRIAQYTLFYKYLKDNTQNINLIYNLLDNKSINIRKAVFILLKEMLKSFEGF